jgi:hypothetical protein
MLRRSLSSAALVLLAAQACGPSIREPRRSPVSFGGDVSAPKVVTPARIVAVPDGAATFVETDPDGATRFIARGMRVLSRPDGSLERGRQLFPIGRQVRAQRLPERLGGGFLFFASASSSTHIWRAATWTGDLTPLANLDFDVERIVPGFDRVYVQDQRSYDLVALDPETGKTVDLGALPPSPSYSTMAFADGWMGAVEVPFRGVLVTFDAGASWRPLGFSQTYGVNLENEQIVVNSSLGRYVIDPDGSLRKRAAGSEEDATFADAGRRLVSTPTASAPIVPPDPPRGPPLGPFGKFPLREAILHGFPDSRRTAVVAKDGALGRVRLSDGKLLDVDTKAFSGGGACQPILVGRGFGFVCGQERGRTDVYAFRPPLSLEPVLSFDEPRYVAASGNGALVIRGPCTGLSKDSMGSYCIRSRDGRLNEMRVRGDLGVERVVSLASGSTAVLVPPRLGAPGTLTVVAPDGSATTVKLELPKADASTLALLRKGLWLDGFIERESRGSDQPEPRPGDDKKGKNATKSKGKLVPGPGKTELDQDKTDRADKDEKDKYGERKTQLAGWVVAGGPFVGVRVDMDGAVHVGRVESDIDRALLSSELALVTGRSGAALESTDGGFRWNEVTLPADSGDPVTRAKLDPTTERGCTRVGCVVGSWMRVGWRGKSEQEDLETVKPPQYTSLPASGGGRWQMSCAPTGESAGPPLAKPAVAKTVPEPEYGYGGLGMYGAGPGGYGYGRHWGATPPATPDALTSSEWLGFKGVAAPARKKTDLGFDLGTEYLATQMRAYAWGAKGADWERAGNFVVRAYDPYSVPSAVWSSATTRSPWGDSTQTGQVFGRDMNMPAAWFPTLEPSGRAAAILLSARGTAELLLVEEGRAPVLAPDAAKWGLYNQVSGAVKLGSTWYVGSYIQGSSFRLFRIEAGKIFLVKEYTMSGGWRPNTTMTANLVRNARGDALGVWVELRRTRGYSTRWFVFSIDPNGGDVLDTRAVEPPELANFPPACHDGADGWLLVGEPPVDPYVDYVQSAEGVRARRVEAKMLVQGDGLCVQSLSAESDTPIPKQMAKSDMTVFARGHDLVPMVLEEPGRTGRRWGFRCVP